jgi:hypothetical protein
MAIFKAPTTINTQEALISTNLGINTAFLFANTVSNTSALVVAGNSAVTFAFSEVAIGELSSSAQFLNFYTLNASTSSVNEGGSVSFNITSIDNPSETLYWTVSGTSIADGDFSSPTNAVSVGGSVTLAGGVGTIVLTVAADAATEGVENFNFNVRTGSAAGPIVVFDTITIQDTSNTIPTYSIAVNTAPIDEGASKSFIITTINVPDGTTLYWSTEAVTGTITSADFTDSSLTGSVTINSSSGTIIRTATADALTEGAESFLLRLRTGSVSGTIVATSSTTVINDTSISPTPSAYGSNFGYTSGGLIPAVPLSLPVNTIDKFALTSSANATDVGDLTAARNLPSGQSSKVYGYVSGGSIPPAKSDVIDKFPFATDANASGVGNLTLARNWSAGQSSAESGYTSGGLSAAPITYLNTVDKFPFASDANATDVGDLTVGKATGSGQSSTTSGYTTAGSLQPPATFSNIIDKFPFASDTNTTDVGDLTVARHGTSGQSSDVSGYTSGSNITGGNQIDKFPFATNANATDVGNVSLIRDTSAGQSSEVNGYISGGFTLPSTTHNAIDRFPFSANSNTSDVGDLTLARRGSSGQQY